MKGEVRQRWYVIRRRGWMSLHCLWIYQTTEREVALNVTWFCFCFYFTCSHVRCGSCSIVCLRFQVVQIKQVNCKMSDKSVNNYESKTFRDIFWQLHTQEYKNTKKQKVRLHLFYKQSIFDPLCRKKVLACSRNGLFSFRLVFAPANCLEIV